MISAPARIGSHVCEVDTPALLVELDALERNIARMQDRIAGTRLRLRPHAKTHKSTAIANLQLITVVKSREYRRQHESEGEKIYQRRRARSRGSCSFHPAKKERAQRRAVLI